MSHRTSHRTRRPAYRTPTQRQEDNVAFRTLHMPQPVNGRVIRPPSVPTEEAERRTNFANEWLIRFKPVYAHQNAPGALMIEAAKAKNLQDGGDYVFREWNSVIGDMFNWKIVISPTWKGYEDLNWDKCIDTRGRHCIITNTLIPWTRVELAFEIAHIYRCLYLYHTTPPDQLGYPQYPGIEYAIPTTNLPQWRIGGDLCPEHRLILTGMYPCFETGKWMVKVDVIKPDNSIAPISVDQVDIWTRD